MAGVKPCYQLICRGENPVCVICITIIRHGFSANSLTYIHGPRTKCLCDILYIYTECIETLLVDCKFPSVLH